MYRIEAMPTFIFLKNNAKVDELRGANPHKLEELVMRWAGTADELVGICRYQICYEISTTFFESVTIKTDMASITVSLSCYLYLLLT